MMKILSHKQVTDDEEMNEMYLCICHFLLLYGHSINITKPFVWLFKYLYNLFIVKIVIAYYKKTEICVVKQWK